jgi:F420-dependent oxidoreductase-like protein
MEFCVFTEPQQGGNYQQLLAVAKAAEDLGFDGFFRSDHYLRMGRGTGLSGVTDAWTTVTGLARDTERIRLGVLLSAATFRDPGPLAVVVAQVNEMSGDRIKFGLGAGWYEAEHNAFGIPFPGIAERFDRLEEQFKIITGLWQTPEAKAFSHYGKYYRIEDAPGLLKVAGKAHPPIVVGGTGIRRTPRLAAEFADEYNVDFQSVAGTGAAFSRTRQACLASGRDPRSLAYSVVQTVCCARNADELARRRESLNSGVAGPSEAGLIGSPTELVERIKEYAEIGASRVYLQLLDLQDLDHLELLATDVVGKFR